MNNSKKHRLVRDSRDRLIDVLGFGETYPLRDLPVRKLMVPYGSRAMVAIETSQPDCVYGLRDRKTEDPIVRMDGDVAVPAEEPGTGEQIAIESPRIEDAVSYRIRATKVRSGRWAYLHDLAEIEIGLDTALPARVLSGTWLDPNVDSPAATDPRLVDHGTALEVAIDNSQSGVDYRLLCMNGSTPEVISEADVRGNERTIVLRSRPVTEDVVLRILAIKRFDATEQREPQESLLDVVLRVDVRPDAARAVTVDGAHIVDHAGTATIVILDPQPDVDYQVYARAIPDRDFLVGPAEDADVVEVAGEDGRVLRLARPAPTGAGQALLGFTAVGTSVRGDASDLRVPLASLTEDCMVLVQARKQHTGATDAVVESKVWLRQAAVVLVRPDSAPALRCRLVVDQGTSTGALLVTGGQPGVFYHLALAADGAALGRPAYFYRRDQSAPGAYWGMHGMAVGVDFVVARAPWPALAAALEAVEGLAGADAAAGIVDPAAAPSSPIVAADGLAAGTTLHVRAVKALTGIGAELARSVNVEELALLQSEPPAEDGAQAK